MGNDQGQMVGYLAGPMTGIPQFNIPAFDAAALKLRAQGWKIISPAELDDEETRRIALESPDGAPGSGSANGETWGDFLARDVKLIADSQIDVIFVMPGWERSRGARLETFVGAAIKGIPVLDLNWLPIPSRDLLTAWARGMALDAMVKGAAMQGAIR